MIQRTNSDLLCDTIGIEEAYSAKLMKDKLNTINLSHLEVNKPMLKLFLIEIHARIITIQHDLDLRSSKITIKIMRQEIKNLKMFEQDIYDTYPEFFL